ncbi:MAG: sulfatase [Mucinivorans sp.]
MSKMKNIIILPLLACASLSAVAQNAATRRPNILYIMTDDHAQQAISCYDGRYNRTPGIDRIAAEGMRFENSFVANSISGPSRACMITGKHSHANGFLDNESGDFNGEQQTLPKLLQKAGYTTAVIGKWHLGSTPTGFDYWNIFPGQGSYYNPDMYSAQGKQRYPGYATDITTDQGIEWIDSQRNSQKPFCLLLHYKAVHRNWLSDSSHMRMYEDVTFPIPSTFYDTYAERPAAAAQDMNIAQSMDLAYDNKVIDPSVNTRHKMGFLSGELARMTPAQRAQWDKVYAPLTADFMARNLSGNELSEWKYQRYMRDYLKCVASVDDNIVRLLDYLQANGLLENTIVVYASDQGFYLGEHGWFDKRFMYEESMRTPLVVRMPDSQTSAPRGKVAVQMVQNIDYAPTFLELAGVPIPSDIQGESFLPILRGERVKNLHPDGLYYHFYEYPGEHQVRRHEGVRGDRYKLMHFYGHDIDSWELYDLKTDPTELKNLYNEPRMAKVQQDMHARLDRLKVKYGAEQAMTIKKNK